MDAILGLLKTLFWIVLIAIGFLFWRYNGLRRTSEDVKESWSNIGVSVRKQASLINQLIDAVRNYTEGEKLVMLKISEDSSLDNVQQMHQQSGTLLTAVNGLAQRFPDLKANTQYLNLMNAIQDVENKLETQRQKYNASAKFYNVLRSSVPDMFYAKLLGFGAAPYLDFDGSSEQQNQALKDFVSDDGERLNQLLSSAGGKVLRATQQVGASALQHGRELASAAQDKVTELRQEHAAKASLRLVDISGSAAGQSFNLQQEGQIIGRASSAQIVVDDPLVAERHLWLGYENGRWLLRDQGNPPSTFIDDDLETPVTEFELRPELTISLGQHGGTRFRVVAA
jgi:LemA protein